MKKYQMIGTDLDGTLLNSLHQIPEENRLALKKVSREGKEVVIATGRLLASGIKISDKLGVGRYIIACNGAIVYDKKHRQILQGHSIPKDLVKEIIIRAEKSDIYYQLYNEDNYLQGRKTPKSLSNVQKDALDNFYREDGIQILSFENPLKDIDFDRENIYKFIFMDKNSQKLAKFRQELENIPGLSVSSSHKDNVEVMNQGVTKGSGLVELSKIINIPLEHVIGIGDNENDLDMIKSVGLGVAMGNAEDKIKQEADLVTLTNDEFGLAKVVKDYMIQ